jgi:NADPH:quinone reductase-like Zn-dependent oxidoreductase
MSGQSWHALLCSFLISCHVRSAAPFCDDSQSRVCARSSPGCGLACLMHRADELICSADEDVAARVKDITGGKGAYAALEPVGGEITKAIIQSVRNDGHVLIYGAMSGIEFTVGGNAIARDEEEGCQCTPRHLQSN